MIAPIISCTCTFDSSCARFVHNKNKRSEISFPFRFCSRIFINTQSKNQTYFRFICLNSSSFSRRKRCVFLFRVKEQTGYVQPSLEQKLQTAKRKQFKAVKKKIFDMKSVCERVERPVHVTSKQNFSYYAQLGSIVSIHICPLTFNERLYYHLLWCNHLITITPIRKASFTSFSEL